MALKKFPDAQFVPDPTISAFDVEDSALGTSGSELVNHLGIIAKPGIEALMEALAAGGDIFAIGQFRDVRLYSGYFMTYKARVVIVHYTGERYIWESASSARRWNPTSMQSLIPTREIRNDDRAC